MLGFSWTDGEVNMLGGKYGTWGIAVFGLAVVTLANSGDVFAKEKVKIAFTICKLLRSEANTNASGGLQLGRIIANPALHGNLEIRRLFCSE